MLKGDNIRGYIVLEDFKVAGGMSKVSFAKKGDKEYFIKEFLYPKYPTPDSPGSDAVKEKKKKACEAFEKHHREITEKIRKRWGPGGNLVATLDFFREGPCYYKINEKIDTSSISCEEISKLPFKKILLIAKSVCSSVRILHDLNIVHGDLKPDNILIKEARVGYVGKLIDFDDSYFSGNPPEDRECVVGTPEYYSPEQAQYIMDEDEEISGSTLTCKSDIFTLGIIMTEYFTGNKPVVSKGSVWSAINKGETVAFSKVVDPRVRELLLEMLSQKPEGRPDIKIVLERLGNLDKEPPKITPVETMGGGLRGKGLAGAGKDTTKVTLKPPTIKPPVSPPSPPTTGGLRGKGLDIAKKK